MDNTNKNLSRNVRIFRNRLDLTQAELAEASEMSLRAIQDIETNRKAPRGSTISKLAKGLKVTEADLFRDPDVPAPAKSRTAADMSPEEFVAAAAKAMKLNTDPGAENELARLRNLESFVKQVPVGVLEALRDVTWKKEKTDQVMAALKDKPFALTGEALKDEMGLVKVFRGADGRLRKLILAGVKSVIRAYDRERGTGRKGAD